MDYCLSDGAGGADIWSAEPTLDIDGDGVLDAIGLDLDADGHPDDALADLDGTGLADHAVHGRDGPAPAYFTDDGSGTWAVAIDRAGQLRWFGLDGVEAFGGPMVDFDGDGTAGERLLDIDADGLADRVLGAGIAHADTDGDGRWDVRLTDPDGDGSADTVSDLT
ncbi:pullulanase [Mycobacterium sp. NPDC003323]